MAGNPKDYKNVNDWAKTLTKKDAEKIYKDLNKGFNDAVLAKRKAEEAKGKKSGTGKKSTGKKK